MQLHHTQRQLLSGFRCSLRYYSISAVPGKNSTSTPDAVAASGTSAPSPIRRPLASSFGGISIQNVAIPTKSQGLHNKTNRPSQTDGSKSSNAPRTSQQERYRTAGRPPGSAMSGWGDGLVSLSFSSRLKMHQKKKTTQNTDAHPDAQERRQHSKPKQRAQMQGEGRQREQRPASHTPRSRDRQNSASAAQTSRRSSVDTKPKEPRAAASMTRPPTSRHAQSKPPSTTALQNAAAAPSDAVTKAVTADRAARLAALSSTNLNALFRTRDTTPVAGTPLPAYASATARVRSVLERSAGDYSRFLPRRVGVRKSVSRPPALRTARHALAAQRDVSLAQRRVALHIIGGLAQPRRQVSA